MDLIHNWSENSINKSSIYYTFKRSMKSFQVSVLVTTTFLLRVKSINYLVHVSSYLSCSATNRRYSNHYVRRLFPKQPWDILPKQILIKSYNKCMERKMTIQRIILEKIAWIKQKRTLFLNCSRWKISKSSHDQKQNSYIIYLKKKC